MGRPVTRVEALLQSIADSLSRIEESLQQAPAKVGAAVEAGAKERPAKKTTAPSRKKS